MQPMLVNGTKEKNSAVKSTSESALVALLHLRDEDKSGQNKCLQVLDTGAKDALQDVITKVKSLARIKMLKISQCLKFSKFLLFSYEKPWKAFIRGFKI
jgi:hypothetical protein